MKRKKEVSSDSPGLNTDTTRKKFKKSKNDQGVQPKTPPLTARELQLSNEELTPPNLGLGASKKSHQIYSIDVSEMKLKGDREEYQDAVYLKHYNYQTSTKQSSDIAIFSVYDGHGQLGATAANLCATKLPKILSTHLQLHTNSTSPLMSRTNVVLNEQGTDLEKKGVETSNKCNIYHIGDIDSTISDSTSLLSSSVTMIPQIVTNNTNDSNNNNNNNNIRSSREDANNNNNISYINSSNSNLNDFMLKQQGFQRFGEEEIQTALENTMKDINGELLNIAAQQPPSSQEFGTTAIVGVMWNYDRLTIGNVGDCKAVLYRRNNSVMSRVMIEQIKLSENHNLKYENELQRIKKLIKLNRSTAPRIIVKKAADTKRLLPPSSFSKREISEKKLSLDITRSLGHMIMGKFGVIHQPEFKTVTISEFDVLVMATDGFWNLFEEQEITQVIEKNWDESTRIMIDVFHQKIISIPESEDRRLDNITALIIKFLPFSTIELNESKLTRMDSSSTADLEELNRVDTDVADYDE